MSVSGQNLLLNHLNYFWAQIWSGGLQYVALETHLRHLRREVINWLIDNLGKVSKKN